MAASDMVPGIGGAPLGMGLEDIVQDDTPAIEIELVASDDPAVNGSDAVFAAVAAATWRAAGFPAQWPCQR